MIEYAQDRKLFFLDGKDVSYVIYINDIGYPEHLYYGAKIPHDTITYTRTGGCSSCTATPPGGDALAWNLNTYSRFSPEITFAGTGDYREPTLLVENALGDRLSDLLFVGYEILPEKPKMKTMPSLRSGETLVLHLRDALTDFAADLYYTVYDDANVIARRVVYRNEAKTAVTMRRAYSFAMGLPESGYEILSLYGGWAKERQVQRTPMHNGVFSIDSKRGSSSAVLNPFLAVCDADAGENAGEVWGFNLVYSGSFTLKVQGKPDGSTVVLGGIQDFDFSWKLDAGESLETPEVVIAFSNEGLGGMSRAFHDVYREHMIDPRRVKAHRPVVINNWEATTFKFNNQILMDLADAAVKAGADTFVLDDGWFGKREDDTSGLGDWVVNTQKLEGGLTPIVEYVRSKGMTFGLWFEPEMISEDSDLYRAHPDYAIGVPGRPHCYGRHQFVLDLTRAEVRDYIVDSVNAILHTHNIGYVKWDFNRNLTEFWSPELPAERQAEFAHRYALGLYDICERIVYGNPGVFFEGCASGGARFDPAMLYYFSQIWTSDDTDAEERTHIQYGTSYAYPLSAMSCHLSVSPNQQTHRVAPLDTRAIIAHLGATGYELDMTEMTDEELAVVKGQTEAYLADEKLMLEGDLYRIDDPFAGNFFTVMVVSKDKASAVVTTYRRMGSVNNAHKRIRLAGLAPDKKYRIRETGGVYAGATLMNVGLVPWYGNGDFLAKKYHLEEA